MHGLLGQDEGGGGVIGPGKELAWGGGTSTQQYN